MGSYADPLDPEMPLDFREYDISPSSPESERSLPHPSQFTGLMGEYRLGFRGMPVAQLESTLEIGAALVSQVNSPLRTRVVDVRQLPDVWPPDFVKGVKDFYVEPGPLRRLTLARIRVDVQPEHVATVIQRSRAEAQTAIGLVASLLDERIAIEQVLEDIILYQGSEAIGLLDMTERVRNFAPRSAHPADLASGGSFDLRTQADTGSGARWYLKGAQAGPSPDGVVYLCVAVEALTPDPSRGNRAFNVAHIGRHLDVTGFRSKPGAPSLGRIAGVRAKIVHHGAEDSELQAAAYYELERMTRSLLRAALGVDRAWPLEPSAP